MLWRVESVFELRVESGFELRVGKQSWSLREIYGEDSCEDQVAPHAGDDGEGGQLDDERRGMGFRFAGGFCGCGTKPLEAKTQPENEP